MKLWIEGRFWRETRKALGADHVPEVQKILENIFSKNGNGAALSALLKDWEDRSYSRLPKKTLWHFRINEIQSAARIVYFRVDAELSDIFAKHEIGPMIGDFLFMGAIPGRKHDLQSQSAQAFIRRAYRGDLTAELFEPARENVTTTESEQTKVAIDESCGVFDSEFPFESYDDYKAKLKGAGANPDICLDKRQFDILLRFFKSTHPCLMMGCAGSGKTQLVATALASSKNVNSLSKNDRRPNAYFALSAPLLEETEDLTCRIALCRVKNDISGSDEREVVDRLSAPVLSRPRTKTTKKILADAFKQSGAKIDLFPISPEFHDANKYLFGYLSESLRMPGFQDRRFSGFDRVAFRNWRQRTGNDSPAANTDKVAIAKFELQALYRYLESGEGPTFCDYRLFKTWFNHWKILVENQETVEGFDVISVWTEIRGVIKGFLGSFIRVDSKRPWHWGAVSFPLGKFDYLETEQGFLRSKCDVAWDVLKQTGMAELIENREWLLRDVKSNWRATVTEYMSENRIAEPDRVVRIVESIFKAAGLLTDKPVFIDAKKTRLSLGEYLGLPSSQTTWHEGERKRLYRICEAYENELKAKGDGYSLPDDNDLARTAAASAVASDSTAMTKKPFSEIFVDECQDFSEMQLLSLASLGRGRRIMFAGDQHQIINPTYFDPDRIPPLFRMIDPAWENRDWMEFSLNQNYRGTKQIVNVSNRIKVCRRKIVGAFRKAVELPEEARKDGKETAFLFSGKGIALPDFLSTMTEDSDIAFIVSNDQSKQRVVESLPDCKREAFGMKAFTIQECKGLERGRVVCLDLIGSNSMVWGSISSKLDDGIEQARFRYYFNTLYVGATRAQSELLFIESNRRSFELVPWLANSQERAMREDDLGSIIKDAIVSFARGEEYYRKWASSDNPDADLARAVYHFQEARRYYTPNCGIELDEIEKRIALCEAETRLRDGDCDGAALKLFDLGLDDEIRNRLLAGSVSTSFGNSERLVARFLSTSSFIKFLPEDVKTIVNRLHGTNEGRKALGAVYRKDLAALTEQVQSISELLPIAIND